MARSDTQDKIDRTVAKRRAAAARREEADDLLRIGKVSIRAVKADRDESKKVNMKSPRYYNIPSSPTSRPVSPNNRVTVHFAFTSVSKTAPATFQSKPVSGGGSGAPGTAAAHSRYIEREAAAEVIEQTTLARVPEGLIRQAGSETPSLDQTELANTEVEVSNSVPLIFSNISDDPAVRQSFWDAVERTERTPTLNSIVFDTDIIPDIIREIASNPNTPAEILAHIAGLQTAMALSAKTKTPLKLEKIKGLSPEQGGRLLVWQESQPWYSPAKPLIKYESGRGGRIQSRIVAELPHELSGEARARIVKDFTEELGAEGFMFTAVVHAPDKHNDARNYHLHLILHDRPAKFLADHEKWDFEVTGLGPQKHNGNARIIYPHRQHKIERAADRNVPRGELKFIPSLRKRFVEISNAVLQAEQIEKRYDHRSYQDMGITKTPTVHLGTKAAALESQGIATIPGVANAYSAWTSIETNLERQLMRSVENTNAYARSISREIETVITKPSVKNKALDLVAERTVNSQQNLQFQRDLDLLAMLRDKAESRARKTLATTEKLIADIEAKGDQSHDKRYRMYRSRNAEAGLYLAKLSETFDQDIPLIADITQRRNDAAIRVKNADTTIAILLTKAREEAIAKQARKTVSPLSGLDVGAKQISLPGITMPPIKAPVPTPPAPTLAQTSSKKSPLPAQPSQSPAAAAPAKSPPVQQPKINQPTITISADKDGNIILGEPTTPAKAKPVRPITPITLSKKIDQKYPATQPTFPGLEPEKPSAPPIPKAPAKVSRKTEDEWNQVVDKIAIGRHFLMPEPRSPIGFDVSNISDTERNLLLNPALHDRTQKRLHGIYERQHLELHRAKQWLQSITGKLSDFPITDGVLDTQKATKAVQTIMAKYAKHPDLITAVDRLSAERDLIASEAPTTPSQSPIAPTQTKTDPGKAPVQAPVQAPIATATPMPVTPPVQPQRNTLEDRMETARLTRIAAAEKKFPNPQMAKQPLVREFLQGLRADQSDQALQSIVEKIERAPEAARECFRLHPNLYDSYLRIAKLNEISPPKQASRVIEKNREL